MALSKIAHANGTTSVTIPATAQAGDLGVLFDVAGNASGGPPAQNAPSDWEQIHTSDSGNARQATYYKILDSGDPSASVGGMNGGFSEDKILIVFRSDAGAIAGVTPSTVESDFQNGNPAAATPSESGGTPPLISFGNFGATGDATTGTSSPAEDERVDGGSNDHCVKYKIYNSSPADHTYDMNDQGSGNLVEGLYLQIAEAASAGVFFGGLHNIENGMKPSTAAGMGGVLVE